MIMDSENEISSLCEYFRDLKTKISIEAMQINVNVN